MFKLMKYEFRKMWIVLGLMALSLVALQAGFVMGDRGGKPEVMGICLVLLTLLAFTGYLIILLSGISSYARELNDKTGYLTFMAPVGAVSVVASRLLVTMIAAVVMAGLFGSAVYFDVARLLRDVELDPEMVKQLDFAFRMYVGGASGLNDLFMHIAVLGITVVIEVLAVMCAACLAITLSATLLQNKKGFLRFLVSFALFCALQFAMNSAYNGLIGTPRVQTVREATRYVGLGLALETGFCVLYAGVSAWLLDRKVSL